MANDGDVRGPIIALDVGDVRIGVAIADALLLSVSPHCTFTRAQGEAEKRIAELIVEIEPRLLIVGIPLSQQGERTEQCERVERFIRRLVRRTSVPVAYVDEYLSSEEAKERLQLSPRMERSLRAEGALDAAAAAVILEDYLASVRK